MQKTRVVLAQIGPLVGDIYGNTERVIQAARKAKSELGADLVLFPECTLIGYPPEDLLFRPSVAKRVEKAIAQLKELSVHIPVVVGYPRQLDGQTYNSIGFFVKGQLVGEYAKQKLPNYEVFDDKRYFATGSKPLVVEFQGIQFGLILCEDTWEHAPAQQAVAAGAEVILSSNASPFHTNKNLDRVEIVQQRVAENKVPVLYVNQVCGQDELVFDGGSIAVDAFGKVAMQAPHYEEGLYWVDLERSEKHIQVQGQCHHPSQPFEESLYQALVKGLKDYVNLNGFKGVVLGLSGGIDSALSLAIAVDALGKERVHAIMMPSPYTSEMSIEDASLQAENLGVEFDQLSISDIFQSALGTLAPVFEGWPKDTTEENLQARIRGMLLMAVSNKKGYMVLTTGNKSELAVGYATLYGDMVGGFNVLKDVPKTTVYRLSHYRNQLANAIPERVIERPPSAELAPDQKDEDSLPPYERLDEVIRLYVEQDESADDIVRATGFCQEEVYRVIRLIDRNEYKRRQSPIGVRVSKKGFGKDRRYPITNGWTVGD